jgi:hypothetical protein
MSSILLHRLPSPFLKAYAIGGAISALSIAGILLTTDLRGLGIFFAGIDCVRTFLFWMTPTLFAGMTGCFSQKPWTWRRMAGTLACFYAFWGAILLVGGNPAVFRLYDLDPLPFSFTAHFFGGR